jgi:hypothetical protein
MLQCFPFFSLSDGGGIILRRLTSSGLYGIISKEIEIFMNTALRTSNPTFLVFLWEKKPSVEFYFLGYNAV